jgi:hypothetical protein
MDYNLEQEFAHQLQRLQRLQDARRSLESGSAGAEILDKQILDAEDLVTAYRALLWYEKVPERSLSARSCPTSPVEGRLSKIAAKLLG